MVSHYSVCAHAPSHTYIRITNNPMKINIDKYNIQQIKEQLEDREEPLPYSQKDWDDLITEIVVLGLPLYLETL